MKSGKERSRRVAMRASALSVVEVIPIVKGAMKPSLSYFTGKSVDVGEFVKVPLRKGEAVGIVTAVHDAEKAKAVLKSSPFALKKLGNLGVNKKSGKGAGGSEPEKACIGRAFMAAAEKTAKYYSSSPGAVLDTLLPNIILDEPQLVFTKYREEEMRDLSGPRNEPLLIQLDEAERFGQYKSIIRESLAKKTSVMLVAPTEEEALDAFEFLSHGITEYAYLFTLSQSKKALKKTLEDAASSERPVLFVTTPSGVSFNRPDLETIILERENSRGYRTFSRPYMHLRVFLEYLIQHSPKRLIMGDSVLSIESLWKEKEGEYKDFFPLKWRLSTNSHARLIDMKASQRESKEFEVLSPELKELISKALAGGEKIFLFGARKGLSPTTVCGDCGSVLPCKNCGSPVVLHQDKAGGATYICHACRARRPAETTCDFCGSWKLNAIGVGTDLIKEEVRRLFPEARTLILDKEHASTDAKVRKVISDFKEGGDVLVGTELAFLHLKKVPYIGLVSADALFSIPDFSINERIFYLVSRLREISEKEIIIQTRNIGKLVLTWASAGNILDFYKAEIAERGELTYPPFSLFIKISPLSPGAAKSLQDMKGIFSKWRPDMVKDALVMRLPRDKWPDEDLSAELSLLGPEFSIKVDPESIL
jgi:primosomal protein N'